MMTKTLKIDLVLYLSLAICLIISLKAFGISEGLQLGAIGTVPFIYCWVGLKSIQGRYLFSREENRKKALGIFILIISVGVILTLTYANLFEFSSGNRRRSWSEQGTFWEMLEDGMMGYQSRHLHTMYIIQGVIFYFVYVIISLIFQWFPKNKDVHEKVLNDEKINLLLELHEREKLSSDDFVDEIRKLTKE